LRNHDFTPLVRYSETIINQRVNNIPQISELTTFGRVLPTKNGVITPAESQATAPLVKNSDKAFLCPTDNFLTKIIIEEGKDDVNPLYGLHTF